MVRTILRLGLALGLSVIGMGLVVTSASANPPEPPVTLCHWQVQHVYEVLTLSPVDVFLHGHTTHANDIIPGFDYPAFDGNNGGHFPGLNLTQENQAILANHCVVPTQTPTPTKPPVTTTATATTTAKVTTTATATATVTKPPVTATAPPVTSTVTHTSTVIRRLPHTGASSPVALMAGFASLLLGVALLFFGRRTRGSH